MKEAQLCTEIVNSFKAVPEAWAWKIPDASPMLRAQQRYIPARAFDILGVHEGRVYAIEAKLIRGMGCLAEKSLTGFEMECLQAVEDAGGKAYLAIGYRHIATPAQQLRAGLTTGPQVIELHMLPWNRWVSFMVANPNAKSMPREEILNRGSSVPWMGNGVWDFGTWLDG